MTEKGTQLAKIEPILPVEGAEFKKRRAEAINNLITGRTPLGQIKKRPGRGGGSQRYVDIVYMTEQANLITTFKWKQEVVKEEEYRDKNGKVLELGVLVRVTFYGADGEAVSKEQWGQKEVMYQKDRPDIPVCYFDDKKAAISDGVKKCLSYFGIAADVYAGKELEFNVEELGFEGIEPDQRRSTFLKMAGKLGFTRPSVICEKLGVKSLDEIKDFTEALEKLEAVKGGG